MLPGKSFRNSLSEEFLEKRRIELNKYLQVIKYKKKSLLFVIKIFHEFRHCVIHIH